MAFDFSSVTLVPGRTIAMELDMIPGAPVVHIEFLGIDNKSFMESLIVKANAKTPKTAAKDKKVTVATYTDAIEEHRADILHAVRKLEGMRHTDGRLATDADIPDFIAGLPPDIVEKIWFKANSVEAHRPGLQTVAEEKALAEK